MLFGLKVRTGRVIRFFWLGFVRICLYSVYFTSDRWFCVFFLKVLVISSLLMAVGVLFHDLIVLYNGLF